MFLIRCIFFLIVFVAFLLFRALSVYVGVLLFGVHALFGGLLALPSSFLSLCCTYRQVPRFSG